VPCGVPTSAPEHVCSHVVNNDTGNVEDAPAAEAALIQIVEMEEDYMNDWLLQVAFLQALGNQCT
jgi:hypothetical protein